VPKFSRLRRAKGQLEYPFQNAPPRRSTTSGAYPLVGGPARRDGAPAREPGPPGGHAATGRGAWAVRRSRVCGRLPASPGLRVRAQPPAEPYHQSDETVTQCEQMCQAEGGRMAAKYTDD
jgi:hypothetical protein